jgi:DNA-binding NtrC family response regulator
VRELENVTRKALLAAQGYTITLDHVRAALNKTGGEMYSAMRPFGEYVDELLAATRRGEITDIMRLGISRITMKAKLVQFGLHPGQDTDQEP